MVTAAGVALAATLPGGASNLSRIGIALVVPSSFAASMQEPDHVSGVHPISVVATAKKSSDLEVTALRANGRIR